MEWRPNGIHSDPDLLRHRDNKNYESLAVHRSLRKRARGKGTRVARKRGGRAGEYEKLTCPRAEAVEPGCWG